MDSFNLEQLEIWRELLQTFSKDELLAMLQTTILQHHANKSSADEIPDDELYYPSKEELEEAKRMQKMTEDVRAAYTNDETLDDIVISKEEIEKVKRMQKMTKNYQIWYGTENEW